MVVGRADYGEAPRHQRSPTHQPAAAGAEPGSGSSDFADDQTRGAEQPIAERALANVRAAGEGEANRARAFFARRRRLRAEELDNQRLQQMYRCELRQLATRW